MNKEFLQSLREQIKSGTVTEQEPMSRHTSFLLAVRQTFFFSRQQRKKSRMRFFVPKKQGFLFLLWVTVVTCWYPMKVFGE